LQFSAERTRCRRVSPDSDQLRAGVERSSLSRTGIKAKNAVRHGKAMTTNARLAVHAGTGMRMRRIRSAHRTNKPYARSSAASAITVSHASCSHASCRMSAALKRVGAQADRLGGRFAGSFAGKVPVRYFGDRSLDQPRANHSLSDGNLAADDNWPRVLPKPAHRFRDQCSRTNPRTIAMVARHTRQSPPTALGSRRSQ